MIEEVSESSKPRKRHYLPHHPVIREGKDATKVRIVFNASTKGNGPGLNECLYKGPQLTSLIFEIPLRFRTLRTLTKRSCKLVLTLSWRRSLSYRNQSIDLLRKSMDWFLYDNGLRHKRVNPNDSDYLRF